MPSASCRCIRMRESMSTQPDPWGSGAVEIATRNAISSVGLAQAHPLTKPSAMRKHPSAGLGPVTTYPIYFYFFFFFSHTFAFQLLDKPSSQVSSLLPPGSCLRFLSRIGFSNPTARRFFHRVLLTHALAVSASQFVVHTRKSPNEFIRVCTPRGSNSRN